MLAKNRCFTRAEEMQLFRLVYFAQGIKLLSNLLLIQKD